MWHPPNLEKEHEDPRRHYAYRLLTSYERIGQVMDKVSVPAAEHISLPVENRSAVCRFVRRLLLKSLGTRPRVHKTRSFVLDSRLYRMSVHPKTGRRFLLITTLETRPRLALPLLGIWHATGNLRVVLDPIRHRGRSTVRSTSPPNLQKRIQWWAWMRVSPRYLSLKGTRSTSRYSASP